MLNLKRVVSSWQAPVISVLSAFLFVGCQSGKQGPDGSPTTQTKPAAVAPAPPAAPAAPEAPPAPVAPAVTPAPVIANEAGAAPSLAIRIHAGASAPYTDSSGNVWLPDQGFEGGEVIDRPSDMQIANTEDSALYRTEHYGMTAFSYKVPNGKYTVKLHFAETYEGISGPGQRVFSITVEGQEFKNFDVWAKAGGGQRAYVETVNVEVTDGKLDISFATSGEQSPEINGIEIIPSS